MEYERVRAEVDLEILVHNMKEIKKAAPQGTKFMAVVKADAYGHGAVPVSKALAEAGTDYLGVAICEEGIELRENNIELPILILGGVSEEGARQAIKYNLIQTVFSIEQAKIVSKAASELCRNAEVHFKIDSGMGRLGFLPGEESIRQIVRISQMPGILPMGIYSHFASSNEDAEYTGKQYNRFIQVVDALETAGLYFSCKHISNSGAIMCEPRFSLDMVRAGIILYGEKPSICDDLNVRPVLSLKSRIRQINEIKAGESIGYGRTYVTVRDTLVGVVPVGYADGYSRRLSNKGSVLIQGQAVPVIGNVCMDMFMVDVTDIQGVETGDEVVLIGRQGDLKITAGALGEMIGTISYEVLCNVSKRVPKKYI